MEQLDIAQFHSCKGSLYWHGCYRSDSHFRQYIHPDTYAHPAKASMLLMDRIFKHLKQLGLLNKNDVVCDFMSGSGRTGIMASLHGHDFVGVELEPHFIKMLNQNKDTLENRIGRKVNWQILQGDSRKLSEILKEKELVGITSPPYQDVNDHERPLDSTRNKNNRHNISLPYSSNPQNIGNLKDKPMVGIVSPPYQDTIATDKHGIDTTKLENGIKNPRIKYLNNLQYSSNTQNIGNLKDKPIIGIVSPPYSESIKGGKSGIEWQKEWGQPSDSRQPSQDIKYGQSKQNIGNLPDKNLVGITSPPYDLSVAYLPSSAGEYFRQTGIKGLEGHMQNKNYNQQNPENLGNQQGESYLSAMLQVYSEAKKVMPILVTITKNPTRNGKLRRLDLDTTKLLMMAGYQIVDYHRTVLWESRKQATLTGLVKHEQKGRLSFFKRLSVQKGNLAAQWEDILVAVR